MTSSDETTTELDAVYRERAHLVAYLAATADAVLLEHAPDAPDWAIIYVTAGNRQMSWHIAHRDLDLFDHVERVTAGDPRAQWDGHTTSHKYTRLRGCTHEAAAARRDLDMNPAALAWARSKVEGLLTRFGNFERQCTEKGDPNGAKVWRLAAWSARGMLLGNGPCVIGAFDERLPEWKTRIAQADGAAT